MALGGPGPDDAILARGLVKTYGRERALDGFDLRVPRGVVWGLLGPNGAGKTTAVRTLATLLALQEGEARVAGVDVRADPQGVRRRIGLSGQTAAVDEILGGRQNLVLFGRLGRLGRRDAAARADELLERFGLVEAAGKPVKKYSGGMRRRLDLAVTLLFRPEVLFLDEPTTGLDPRNRGEVWAAIRQLVADGTTVLLTTQYLDEADQLAAGISVMDHGRVIAEGRPDELKRRVGGDRLEVTVVDPADLDRARAAIARWADEAPQVDVDLKQVSAPVSDRVGAVSAVLAELGDSGIRIDDLALRRPTLDDVFLTLTGHSADTAAAESDPTDAREVVA
ncbi:ATP-binding cassette domain-containing protein [Intrasporangium sp.]|uniref:ATP-binding cassette domain-containing protein n=1 Tax=Intrasporangium sp. TaxID=1925024 RepID=UPI0029398816|nr:ATP-binding cassette domain-containing protein [Intrasporangium sp.]MDV3219871.1 ATP-binding cassette domain-containing protein [Intrasporangium sp.]